MRDIGLHHFKCFLSVAETQSLSASAVALGRTPSSVSRSVALIEEAAGARVFRRSSAGMVLTLEGSFVLARATRVTLELQQLRQGLSRRQKTGLRANSALLGMEMSTAPLKAVIAVADVGSMRWAAEKLSLSQPALSYSIRQLEADLGCDLFMRQAAGTRPTSVGALVVQAARRILGELGRLRDDLSSAGQDAAGLVRIGGLAYSRATVLPAAIGRTIKRHAKLQIRTVEGPIGSLVTALREDSLDAVICALPDERLLDGVMVEPLAADQLFLFVGRGHALAGKAGVGLADLARHDFILPPQGTITRHILEDYFLARGMAAPKGRVETSSHAVIRNLLLAQPLVTIRSSREFSTNDPGIVPLDLHHALPTRDICILTSSGLRQTRAVEHFLAAVRDVARGGDDHG